MKELKILFVLQGLQKAGAERMLVNMCNELVKIDHVQIAVFLMRRINQFENELSDKVIVVGGDVELRFSVWKKNTIKNQNYIDFVEEFQPNIIHSHLFHADLFSHSYQYKNAVYVSHLQNSIVKEYDGFDSGGIFTKTMWANFYENRWIIDKYKKFNTNFIACSKGAYELHQKKIKLGRILTLPNASPLPIGQVPKSSPVELVNLIWVGRLNEVKRPQIAIKIAKILKTKGVKLKLKIVGDGVQMQDCLNLIAEEHLVDSVQMLGLVDDMSKVYQSADLMIHTSVYEGLPLVFTEANSYGIPIITTDCMPDNEFISDRENGIILHSDSPEDFAQEILHIIDNPKIYTQFSSHAIEHSKKFGMENYIQKLLEFYHSILEKK
jgi:glycosyltransferase involved in cell wall biosynthesis